jgi:hypothetical protein
MQTLVALAAQRDEVGLRIITQRAAPSSVVNVEIFATAADLTAPVIARQDFFTQRSVQRWCDSDSGPLFRDRNAHVARSGEEICSGLTAGQSIEAEHSESNTDLSASNLVPSRKSAQINGVRGRTIVAAICDEMAFWPHERTAADPGIYFKLYKSQLAVVERALEIAAHRGTILSPRNRTGWLFQPGFGSCATAETGENGSYPRQRLYRSL